MTTIASTSASVLELDAQFPAQDYVLINGEKSPGKAIVQRANSPRGWDERGGYGLNGATLIPKGDPLATFSVRFEFWDPAEMPAWYAYAAKYFDKSVRFNPGTTTSRALGIYHPILAAPPIRITQVVVLDANGLDKSDDGLWFCEVFFKQYRKPKLAAAPPQAAIPAAAASTPTATDAAQVEMQQKLALFQQLAAQLGGNQ